MSAGVAERARTVHRYARHDVLGGLDLSRLTSSERCIPRQLHDSYLIAVADGAPHRIWVARRWWTVCRNAVLLLNPFDVFGAEQVGHGTWGYRIIYPTAAHMAAAYNAADANVFPSAVVEDQGLAAAARAFHEGHWHQRSRDAEPGLLALLSVALQRHGAHGCVRGTAEHRAILTARDYIHTHYRARVRIADIAEAADLSTFHLIRIFHEFVGVPPYTYLDQVRIARARRLLADGYSISAAASRTGYSDQPHLTRHFKRLLGVTPGEYCRTVRRSVCAA